MDLVRLHLGQFKAIANADLELSNINVIIGPNNAGKSSVLQAPALLAQSTEQNQLQPIGRLVDLGSAPEALVHQDGAAAGQTGWQIGLTWIDRLPPDHPIAPGASNLIQYIIAGGLPNGQAGSSITVATEAPPPRLVTVSVRTSSAIEIEGREVRNSKLSLPGFRVDRPVAGSSLWAYLPSGPTSSSSDFRLEQLIDPASDATTNYPLAVATPYLSRLVREAIASYRYIDVDRRFPQSQLNLWDNVPVYMAAPYEIASAFAYERELERRVSDRLEQIFPPFRFELRNRPNRYIDLLATTKDGVRRNVVNMGTGFNQVLWTAAVFEWTLLQLEDKNLPRVIGLEEPELHLHPAAQSRVAAVLAEYAKAGLQILCTTHSEHILMALLREVLAERLSPRQLGIFYVDNGRVSRLPVDDAGRIEGGLKGFFEANEAELLEHLRLLLKKDEPTQ